MGEKLSKYIQGDRIIWFVIIALAIFSSLVVYSATGNLAYKHQGGNAVYYLFRHLGFMAFGFALIVGVHRIHYKWFARFAKPFLYFSILLLVITMVAGVNLNNASRWLTIPVVGISFQPSELAKIALMIYLAKVLGQCQNDPEEAKRQFWPMMAHVGVVCLLIFKDNFSTAGLLGFTSLLVMFIGRSPMKYILLVVAVGIAGIVMVLLLADHVPYLHRAKTWKARVERFFEDDKGDGEIASADYQAERSKMAIATGGFFGKGPGNSQQRYFLPHPYSDFVYAIIAEEFGFIGAFLVMLAYLILLFRSGVIVRASTRTFPAFLVIGLSTLIISQALINMGVAVGVFPVTGQPLPLVSMGGTSTLFTCLALGAILSVSSHNMNEAKPAEQAVNTEEE